MLVDPPLIELPAAALVLLVGPTGAGKSTFAARHFLPSEILASDAFRALLTDDEADQTATADAFELLHLAAAGRLTRGRLTVVDATNVQAAARRPLLRLAARLGAPAIAIAFDLPLEVAAERNRARPGRTVPKRALRRQHDDLQHSLSSLEREGYAQVVLLRTAAAVDVLQVARRPPERTR